MSADEKIYVDATQPATLNDGAGILTDCPTLQEAVMAWHRLAPEQRKRATVKVFGGPVYNAESKEPTTDCSVDQVGIIVAPSWSHIEVYPRSGC